MIAEILGSFAMNVDHARRLVADLDEDQMIFQPAEGVNPPAWILGHLVYSFQGIGGELGLAPWLPPGWIERFKTGSRPSAAEAGYPGKAELLAALDEGHKRLRQKLSELEDADLDIPLPDERYRDALPTLGSAVLHILAVHTATHLGQLSAWRRFMGLCRVQDPL